MPTFRNLAYLMVFLVLAVGFVINRRQTEPEQTVPSSESASNNPGARAEYEFMRLRDPVTGKIPEKIRERELDFAKSLHTRFSPLLKTAEEHWQPRGPFYVGGRTRALALDVTDDNVILAGGVSGGVWRSFNGGASWTKVTTPDQLHSVTCILQDTRQGKTGTWYYGTGEHTGNSASGGGFNAAYRGNGIYKSIDGGLTWSVLEATASSPISTSNFSFVWDLAMDTDGVLYAATFDAIYRSVDEGTTWTVVLGDKSPNSSYTDIEVSPNGILYAALSSQGPDGGAYRSEDGLSWTNILPGSYPQVYRRTVIGVAPSDENIVYFLSDTPLPTPALPGTYEHNLWKYTYISGDGSGDGGQWEDRSENLPADGGVNGDFDSQGSYNMVIAVKPDNPDVLFIGGTNLYRSTDAFATYDNYRHIGGYALDSLYSSFSMYDNHYCDQHELIFHPDNPNVMYSSNDGGISRTNDSSLATVSWISLNNGYVTGQFYTVAIDQTADGDSIITGGMQDNGSYFVNDTDERAEWVKIKTGDGAYAAISDGKQFYYASSQNGNTYRYTISPDGTKTTFTKITPLYASGFLFVNPFVLNPDDSNVMYMAAGTDLYVNSDLSEIPVSSNRETEINWKEIDLSTLGVQTVTALGIGTKPAETLYVGSQYGRLFRIDEPSSRFFSVTDIWDSSFPEDAYVSSIAVDPDNASHAVITFSNYYVKSIFATTDGGSNWTHVSGNLEEQSDGSGSGPSVRWIEILPAEPADYYFAGTSTGLYSTRLLNGDSTVWQQEGAEMIGNVVVEMVDARTTDGLVVAATHGNGIYSKNFELTVSQNTYFEPNDEMSEAYGPLSADSSYTAYIDKVDDEDWYYYELGTLGETSAAQLDLIPIESEEISRGSSWQKNGSIVRKLKFPPGFSSNTVFHEKTTEEVQGYNCSFTLDVPDENDFDIEVFQISGEKIDYSEGGIGIDESLSFQALSPGKYFIKVFGYSGNYSKTDPYLLKISCSPATAVFNLRPEKPEDWDSPLIIAKDPMSTINVSEFTDQDSIWIRFSVVNDGPDSIKAAFVHHGLYTSDSLLSKFFTYGHPSGTQLTAAAFNIGVLPAGTHVMNLQIDFPRYIAESNESDNSVSHTITVEKTTSIDDDIKQPDRFALYGNYPNPFNPSTTISYTIPAPAELSLAIYSVSGKLVRTLSTGLQPAGNHTAEWDGRNSFGRPVSSGVYICVLTAGKYTGSIKMLLLK